MPSHRLTLYAQFVQSKYSVTYYNEGDVFGLDTYEGERLMEPDVLPKKGTD